MPTKEKTKKRKKRDDDTKRKKRKKKVRRTARTADRHDLYQLSVQSPEIDAPFFARYHQRYTDRPARLFREDFCGTALLASHWVRLHEENRAIGVDLDEPTLDWGREHNLSQLDDGQRSRIELIRDDVRTVKTERVDVLAALNFSYSFFMTRDELRGYLKSAREAIAPGGLMFLDAWGGSEAQVEQEEERDVEDFTYVWDQAKFDPVSHHAVCKIHFRFKDGSKMKNAFVYEWRLWTLPELQELMTEAGFEDVHVLWEGTDKKTGEGNGKYRRSAKGDADPAWISYVVGRA